MARPCSRSPTSATSSPQDTLIGETARATASAAGRGRRRRRPGGVVSSRHRASFNAQEGGEIWCTDSNARGPAQFCADDTLFSPQPPTRSKAASAATVLTPPSMPPCVSAASTWFTGSHHPRGSPISISHRLLVGLTALTAAESDEHSRPPGNTSDVRISPRTTSASGEGDRPRVGVPSIGPTVGEQARAPRSRRPRAARRGGRPPGSRTPGRAWPAGRPRWSASPLQDRLADPAVVTHQARAQGVVWRRGDELVPARGGEDQVRLALRLRQPGQPVLHLGVLGDAEGPLLCANAATHTLKRNSTTSPSGMT